MNSTAFPKFKIVVELRKLLINNSGITSYVGSNVFPIQAPEGTDGDCIVYFRNKYEKQYTKFGPYEENCEVTFVVVSDNYNSSLDLAERINDLFEGDHLTSTNKKYTCNLNNSSEDLIDDKFLQVLTFLVK